MKFSGLFAGLTTIDFQYFVDSFPEPNKKIKTSSPPDILVGGPAVNAAVAFSWLNGGAGLATVTGRTMFKSLIEEDFRKNNIHCYEISKSSDIKPVVATVVTSASNGDRNIYTHNPDSIRPDINAIELFQQVMPQILMLDGFYPEAVVEFAHIAKKQSVPVVLDCGSWKPQYKQLIPLSDVVICSADFIPPGCKNENDVVEFLHADCGVKKLAISRGGNNLIYSDEGKKGEVPVLKTKITDSLGAGDFLHGAFCFYYLQMKFNFCEALDRAGKFASFTCIYKGTRSWINLLHNFHSC